MPESGLSRRQLHRQELRSELLAAAHALVKEEGYEGLTIRRLAKRVGYAPMSVYSYFADKQDILVALAEDVFGELARRAEKDAPAIRWGHCGTGCASLPVSGSKTPMNTAPYS